jgi:hypothetical protein
MDRATHHFYDKSFRSYFFNHGTALIITRPPTIISAPPTIGTLVLLVNNIVNAVKQYIALPAQKAISA